MFRRKAIFLVGDCVEAQFQGGEHFYKAKISRRHADGTFDVNYDDGDREERVTRDFIRNEPEVRSVSWFTTTPPTE